MEKGMTVHRALIRAILLFLTILPLIGCSEPAPDLESLMKGVVRIVGVDGAEQQRGLGSGFVINKRGDVVTTLTGLEDAKALFVQTEGEGSAKQKPARILWSSKQYDIAVLAVDGLKRPPLAIAEVMPEGGAYLFLLGYPDENCCNGSLQATLEQGAMGRLIKLPPPSGGTPIDAIMHSAQVVKGSTGAPLLDSCGAVVGVASLGLDPSGAEPQGIYFGSAATALIVALRQQKIPFTTVADPCRDL